jgi:hypothetical protein
VLSAARRLVRRSLVAPDTCPRSPFQIDDVSVRPPLGSTETPNRALTRNPEGVILSFGFAAMVGYIDDDTVGHLVVSAATPIEASQRSPTMLLHTVEDHRYLVP